MEKRTQESTEITTAASEFSQNCWQTYKAKLPAEKKNDVQAFSSISPLIRDARNIEELILTVTDKIFDVIEIYYGIGASQISTALVKSVTGDIVQKFGSLKLSDITHAYDRANLKKPEGWKIVTKQELLEPLHQWVNSKAKIKSEYYDHRREITEAATRKGLENSFRQESLQLYSDSVVSGEWKGDIFQAHSIARLFAGHIEQPLKDMFWQQAKESRGKIEADQADRFTASMKLEDIGRTAERIFSNLIIKESIKRKIQL